MRVKVWFLFFVLYAPLTSAGDISGVWKHIDEPGWIEISLEEGNATVIRNDTFPERVGREILKELNADESTENLWHGQVFAEKLGEYKSAEISLKSPSLLQFKVKVGFMSRTIEWVREDAQRSLEKN